MDSRVNAYWRKETLGKSHLELLLQEYDSAVAAYASADQSYARNDFNAGYEQLERAKKFITHLYTTLDSEKGGEVAANLSKLYAFVLNETSSIQGTKSSEQIEAVVRILGNLRSGWAELNEASQANAVAEPETSGPVPIISNFVTSG